MATLSILFLKLSAKLYTSVFHHGLKSEHFGKARGWADTGGEKEELLSSSPRMQQVPFPDASAALAQTLRNSPSHTGAPPRGCGWGRAGGAPGPLAPRRTPGISMLTPRITGGPQHRTVTLQVSVFPPFPVLGSQPQTPSTRRTCCI